MCAVTRTPSLELGLGSNPASGIYKLYDLGSVTYLTCALLSLSGLCSILSDSPSSIISLPHLSEASYQHPLLWDFSIHMPVTHLWPLPTYSVQSESYWLHISQGIGSRWVDLSFYPMSWGWWWGHMRQRGSCGSECVMEVHSQTVARMCPLTSSSWVIRCSGCQEVAACFSESLELNLCFFNCFFNFTLDTDTTFPPSLDSYVGS